MTVNGTATGVNYLGRLSYGTDLADEGDDVQDRYWVKVNIDPPAGPYTSAVVDFPDGTMGNPRIHNVGSEAIFVKP